MTVNTLLRKFPLAALPLLAASCTSTTGYLHKDGSVTVSRGGLTELTTNYWITGAKPGQVNRAGDVAVFRKYVPKTRAAEKLKCEGYLDLARSGKIEVRLIEKSGGGWRQAPVNGSHKLVDDSSPKPFYHWLIP